MNNDNRDDQQATTLAESANYAVWQDTDEGEPVYHLELGMMTLHFYEDEWEELTELFAAMKSA
jgi:hypothetical protein